MEKIHNTSIVHKNALIGKNVEVGPFSIIEEHVEIGDNTKIGPNVLIRNYTSIGSDCEIFNGAVIGEVPMDLKFNDEDSKLIIGDRTVIREFCTLHRGTKEAGLTKIGSDCLIMSYGHIAHDVVVGDNVIISISVNVAGHVEIDDYAIIGGCTPVHQFCKIGKHAFIGGGRLVLQDVPPYILATSEPLKYSGINSVGLRRRKFNLESRTLIKKAYNLIYKSDLNISQAVEKIKSDFKQTDEIKTILNFINNSDRGLI
jgi:UDP-N-acetylglucosamine acyltransferase